MLPRAVYDNDLLRDTIVGETGSPAYRVCAKAACRRRWCSRPSHRRLCRQDSPADRGDARGARAWRPRHAAQGNAGAFTRLLSSPRKTKTRHGPGSPSSQQNQPGRTPMNANGVKEDGGRFDSVAGATVTPRAVIKAVRWHRGVVTAGYAVRIALNARKRKVS